MAIIFGSDGTLYCNSIKYNYKQTKNVIYNNCDGHDSNNGWSTTDVGAQSSVRGYKAGKSFKFTANKSNPMMKQDSFTPTAGHKYYGCTWWKTSGSSFSTGDSRFEWWCNDTNLTGKLTFANKSSATSGNWVLLSSIQTAGSSMASGSWYIRNFLVNPTTESYCCKMIIADLTDAFGSGNEPTKAWCDANILEHNKLCAYSYYTITGNSHSGFQSTSNYGLTLTSNWEPRDHMQYLISSTSSAEGLQNNSGNAYLYSGNSYYASMEVCDYYKQGSTAYVQYFPSTMRYQYYFPIAEPSMGYQKAMTHRLLNGGGGMQDWRRVGVMASRTSFSEGSYSWRFDFDNCNYSRTIRVCNQGFTNVSNIIAFYNSAWGCSISVSAVNKEWCDRWIDSRNSPIIHIKDPTKKTIEFNKKMQEMKKSSTPSYTKSTLDGYVGLTGDSWSGITNASSLKTGQLAFITVTESTNNKTARLVVKVNSVSGTTVYTDNYGWGYSDTTTADSASANSAWWQLCDGYDITCNDVEIHPERSSIEFDKTGTIFCKKLVVNF